MIPVKIFEDTPKWQVLSLYLRDLHEKSRIYTEYKSTLPPEVQLHPGRLVIYWVTESQRSGSLRDLMTEIHNINASYFTVLKQTSGITIYQQTLTYTNTMLRVDLLIPEHFPELVKLRRAGLPFDLQTLINALVGGRP